jgi:hypothetical protein
MATATSYVSSATARRKRVVQSVGLWGHASEAATATASVTQLARGVKARGKTCVLRKRGRPFVLLEREEELVEVAEMEIKVVEAVMMKMVQQLSMAASCVRTKSITMVTVA